MIGYVREQIEIFCNELSIDRKPPRFVILFRLEAEPVVSNTYVPIQQGSHVINFLHVCTTYLSSLNHPAFNIAHPNSFLKYYGLLLTLPRSSARDIHHRLMSLLIIN